MPSRYLRGFVDQAGNSCQRRNLSHAVSGPTAVPIYTQKTVGTACRNLHEIGDRVLQRAVNTSRGSMTSERDEILWSVIVPMLLKAVAISNRMYSYLDRSERPSWRPLS